MIRFFLFFFISVLNLFAINNDIKSTDFNLSLVKYTLANSIHENLDIKSVDKWYLYITKKDLYEKVKNDENRLNFELSNNYMNFQKEIISISKELNKNSFYYDRLLRFSESKSTFPKKDFIENLTYFIVDSSLGNKYELVGRFYIKNSKIKNDNFVLSKKIDIAYIRYIFDISNIRLNNLKPGFKEDIKSLNLEIDANISIKNIKFFDLDMKEIK